jgi:hypothetical protein
VLIQPRLTKDIRAAARKTRGSQVGALSCSGLRTGPLGLVNAGVCGPAIYANRRPRGPTLSANEPTLVCEGLANRPVGQHAVGGCDVAAEGVPGVAEQ